MNSINFYFEKYMSDKGTNGYSDVYNEVFSPRRFDSIKLLEIGIGTLNDTNSNMRFWLHTKPTYQPGASLLAFQEYFPNGLIYGIDIQRDCMMRDERIKTFLLDSTDSFMVENYFLDEKFDFIIDDGDHHYKAQIKTFENFFPKLFNGGVYILEDLAYPQEIMEYFNSTSWNFEFRDGLVIIKK